MVSPVLLCLFTFLFGRTRGEWRPLEIGSIESPLTIPHQQLASARILDGEHCNLYKVVMHQDNYFQYIQYKAHIPDLKEFTLCSWHKFYNHSMDHPIFSYALRDQPREIVSWVSNTDRSSFYQLTIGGHTIYRLNYPVKLFKWYHSCQSWNGRTGEWQLWVDSERVGRGFYNLLVGKKIKGGGLAMTGQIQRQYGGGFSDAPKQGGMFGEVTLVHLYKAALTAGKAYNNHKHHHAHKFHHEGSDESQDLQAQGPQMTPLPDGVTEFPFLRGMQIVPRLPVDQLNVIRQQQQLQQMQQMQLQQMLQQQQQGSQLQVLDPALLTSPFAPQSVRLFKRDHNNSTSGSMKQKESKAIAKEDAPLSDKTKQKRTIDFGVFPGVDLSGLYSGDGFVLGGGTIPLQDLAFNGQNDDISQEEGPMRKWDEPAEWEVRSIMSLCSGCGEDPFRKANILSWRETSKKLYAGALYVPASQQCHHF